MDGLNRVIRVLDKVGTFSRWTNIGGVALLFLMVCLTCLDAVMRYVFNSPIRYVTEIVGIMMLTAVFFAVAHTQNEKAHVSVDVVTSRLAPKSRLIVEFITSLLGLGMVALLIWQNAAEIPWVISHNIVHTQSLTVNKAPFLAIIVLGFTALWLLLLRDFLLKCIEAQKLGLKGHHWLLMLGVPLSFLVLAILFLQPTLWQLSLTTVGIIGIMFSFFFFLSGIPVAFVFMITGFLFVGHIRGLDTALEMLTTDAYRTTSTYLWAAVSFFTMMGFVALYARLGEDLYLAAYRWFGHIKGGLAIATVGASAAFSAIASDTISAVATIGAAVMPEMRRYQYDERLSTGSIIAGGSILGPIIPPGIIFIFYGLLTQMSIGVLFVAAIIPGIIITIIYVITIYVWCRINPQVGPAGERSAWIPRLISLKYGGPTLAIFLLVIFGIYGGVFTPCEGGAIGVMGVFITGLVMRRWTWKSFSLSLLDSGKVISMIFLIIIGAVMFCHFTAWCNLSPSLTSLIDSLNLSPMGFTIVVLIALFVLGFFIDILPLILIGVPIIHPVVVSLGLDPVWFALLVCVMISLGDLTPPIGITLYAMKAINPDIPLSTIFWGTIPFIIGTVISIVIMFLVPATITWLPSVLKF